ncbi:PREDICTED: uncharacterized protein F54H12.2-like [Acropora digitifera]|uniref:uncharacterized protein F54H12.2-like n=1 Tax=Acropora digitifera TaxID=70779 RepID=UPI00077A1825|nr:PREDICTED: uncharacterized protein F54H12.2-like [Acropora digitifera]
MEFLILATETFLDLSRSYFEMEVQLKTSGNANTAYNTVLYPVTNMAHSMIKQLSVHVNGVLLEPQTDHSHYKAFFQTILNNSRNDGETSLHPQGWYNDFDLPALLTADVVNASGNVTLFAFNFTPDGRPEAPTFHPPQSGNVRLQFN